MRIFQNPVHLVEVLSSPAVSVEFPVLVSSFSLIQIQHFSSLFRHFYFIYYYFFCVLAGFWWLPSRVTLIIVVECIISSSYTNAKTINVCMLVETVALECTFFLGFTNLKVCSEQKFVTLTDTQYTVCINFPQQPGQQMKI